MKKLYISLTLVAFALSVNAQSFLNPSFESNNVVGQNSYMGDYQVEDTVDNVYGISGNLFWMHSVFTSICDSVAAYDGTWYFGASDTNSAFAMELDQTISQGDSVYITFYARNCTTDVDIVVGLSDAADTVGTSIDTLTIAAPNGWSFFTVSSPASPLAADYVTIQTLNTNNNEMDFDAFTIDVISPVSVPEVKAYKPQVKLYPNPASGMVRLNSIIAMEQVSIANAIGQQVMTTYPNAKQANLNIEGLPAGIYMVKATVNGATTTQKLLVQ